MTIAKIPASVYNPVAANPGAHTDGCPLTDANGNPLTGTPKVAYAQIVPGFAAPGTTPTIADFPASFGVGPDSQGHLRFAPLPPMIPGAKPWQSISADQAILVAFE